MVPRSPGQCPRSVQSLQSGCKGLPFQGPKCLQSLLVSVEMLHAQPMSKQLLYLQVPALCLGFLAWCGEQLCLESPKSAVPWTAAGAIPLQGHVSAFHLQPAPAVGMLRFPLMESSWCVSGFLPWKGTLRQKAWRNLIPGGGHRKF